MLKRGPGSIRAKMPPLTKAERWNRFWKSAPSGKSGKQYRTKAEIADFRRREKQRAAGDARIKELRKLSKK